MHRPGFQWDTRELLRACGLAVWEFDHLVEGQKPFEVGARGSFPSPVIDVERGYEAYLTRLRARSPKFTRTTLAKERKLGRDAGEVRYVHDERDPAALSALIGWKSAQYRRTGRSDRFARPWIIRLVEQLFHTRSASCQGLLSVLYAGGRPVAAHFGLRSERVLACWFPAYDPAYAKFSPGLVLHLRMAEGAAAQGVDYLDLGRGEKEYKNSLKTRDLSVVEGWVTRRHPVALGHSARRAPVRALRNTVVSRPEFFGPADRLLKRMGGLRERNTQG